MVSFNLRNFLTVDDCNMDELLESLAFSILPRYQESPGSLAVVFDRTFTPGNVCTCVQTYSLIITA